MSASLSCLKRRQAGSRRNAHRGQNLIELVLTLPFVLFMILFLIEMVRIAFTYQAVAIAARQGAQFAAVYHTSEAGLQQMKRTLSASGITASTTDVKQVPDMHAYQASVTVSYKPLFTGSIPLMQSSAKISPGVFDIKFTSVPEVGVY
jgi:hypothetical protein